MASNWFSALIRTVDAATEPVTTANMKSHLRVTHSDDDTYIDGLVAAARINVEDYISRALITQTWAASFDCIGENDRLRIPRPNLISVTGVTYKDGNGDSQNVSSDDYLVNTASEPGQVYFTSVPDYDSEYDNPLTVTFTAGYGANASDIPAPIIHAIKLQVSHWYDHRESVMNIQGGDHKELPMGLRFILSPYRFRFS